MIDLVFRNRTADHNIRSTLFRSVLRAAIAKSPYKKKTVEVSISLVGIARMRALNIRYRHVHMPTNVLAFPLAQRYGKGYNRIVLGDIFICLPYAKKEARERNMPLREYLGWLTVHGFLHLAGYDHERSAAQARKMFSKEKEILKIVGMDRPR